MERVAAEAATDPVGTTPPSPANGPRHARKPVRKRGRVLKRVLIGIVAALVLAAVAFCVYVGNYYHATPTALESAQSDENVTVQQLDGAIAFVPQNPVAGFAFYPGAKVRCEEIIMDAKQKAAVSIQKMLSQVNAEADRLRSANAEKLKSYQESAQAKCQEQIEELHRRAADNSEKAVDAIISGFFS